MWCKNNAMHSMEEQFNKKKCIETFHILSGDKILNEMPHSDTLDYYSEHLSLGCLAGRFVFCYNTYSAENIVRTEFASGIRVQSS